MPQEILVNITPREIRVALVENGILQELHIERSVQQGLLGNIYKGRVNRLLPGIQAAFVDIGLDRSAFLHISDLGIETGDEHYDIRNVLSVGQEILVQIYKNPLGSKGARITTQFTVPARYLVLTPGLNQVAVSQKISNETERNRLLTLIEPGSHGGFIFRTAAEGVTLAEVESDKTFLETLWMDVTAHARIVKPAAIVYQEIPLVLRVLRDMVGYHIEKVFVDNKQAVTEMRAYAESYMPALMERIEYYTSNKPIFDLYAIDAEVQKALERKVYLKSGGHLVFDQTEAMTTIDVNTGSYLGNNNLAQTVLRTNLEAAEMIAHEVRLRNLGGIIIIDFIDMVNPTDKAELLQAFAKALAADSARTELSELSRLGLVQMTRKRTRESLEHVLCVQCPMCQRRGSIKSLQTVCYEIFRELKRLAESAPWPGFLAIVAPAVANELMYKESAMLVDLEAALGKPIKYRAENSYVQERYDILPLSE